MQNSKKFPRQFDQTSRDIAIQALFPKAIILDLPLFKGAKVAAYRLKISPKQRNLAHCYLSPAEFRVFRRFTFPQRANQWLAGRLCAKAAAMSLTPVSGSNHTAWREIEINSHISGRPFIALRGTSSIPDISISHSGIQAAAMAVWPFLCGLDLQEIRDTSRIRSRFATPEEEIIILHQGAESNQPPKAMFTMLWSIKEAVRKAFPLHPLPGFLDLSLQALATIPGGFSGRITCRRLGMPGILSFFAFIEHNYTVALTINCGARQQTK